VSAARAIVAGGGLEALSFRSLEEHLGYTRGVITYHFADKDEIVAAVLQSAVAEIDQATQVRLERSTSLSEKVRAILHTKVQGFIDHPDASEILIAFWARLSEGGPVRSAMSELFAGYRSQAVNLVRAARRAEPRCTVDPQAMAGLLVGIVIGLVIQIRFTPEAFDIGAALDEATAAVVARLQS
jgi:AcrR family transcriptional regulator